MDRQGRVAVPLDRPGLGVEAFGDVHGVVLPVAGQSFATDFSWGYNPSHVFAIERAFLIVPSPALYAANMNRVRSSPGDVG